MQTYPDDVLAIRRLFACEEYGTRHRVLLTSMIYSWSDWVPVSPTVAGARTEQEFRQVVENLQKTCDYLGYRRSDVVLCHWEGLRIFPGWITAAAMERARGRSAA